MVANSSNLVIGADPPVPAVRCMAWMGEWHTIPIVVAECPECGASLEAVVDGWSEGSGYSVEVTCNAAEASTGEPHRYFQSDWQSVMDVVKAWANSPIGGSEPQIPAQKT